jgi:uncharacterized protein (TIGR03382 family)
MRSLIVLAFFCCIPVLAQPNCSGTSTGMVPLTDLGAGLYNGRMGGLYPDGNNTRPGAHDAAGLAIASSLQPLDAAGNPDSVNGKLVMASLGLSNTTQESQAFISLLASQTDLNPRFQFVDGAQGSQTTVNWKNPSDNVWTVFANRLSAAGVTGSQLQVVWMKVVLPAGQYPGNGFVSDNEWLAEEMKAVVLVLKQKYPAVQMMFLSSRIYAGYASTNLHPEPSAYEHGFAVKWLIEQQINGDASVAYTGATPPSPWLAWGPYLWADGLGSDNAPGGIPGRSDGLEWACSEYQNDGTHPGPAAEAKVAQMLLDFFEADTTTQWFRNTGGATLAVTANNASVDTSTPVMETLTASGSGTTGPYTWRVSAGSLPPGVALDTTQTGLTTTLSGTPNTAGTYTFSVTVTDSSAVPVMATESIMFTVTAPAGSGGGSSSSDSSGDGGGCVAAGGMLAWPVALLAIWVLRRRRRATA